MSLSSQEVEGLLKWIEYHIKGYENEQNPQLLASYIKSLIVRQASQQRMVAVLRDFMDDKAEDFVDLLQEHLKTKDFSIPEVRNIEKIKTTAPKKQETAAKIIIEEVRPEGPVSRPAKDNITIQTTTRATSSREMKEPFFKEDLRSERDMRKSHDRNVSSLSTQSISKPNYISSLQFEKKESSSKYSSTKSKEKEKKSSKRDKNKEKARDKEKSRDKKTKDKHIKKSRSKRSPSPYSSNDYDYTDYDYTDYDNYKYDYYSSDSYQYDEKYKKRSESSSNKNKNNQSSKLSKNLKSKEKNSENDKKLYSKKQKNQNDFKSTQKNSKKDITSQKSIKNKAPNERFQSNNDNKITHETSEIDHDHLFIVAVCGIPSQINTIGHILKEFNRFGLIYGIQIVAEKKMALIEFGELEAAYRAVNSRHLFFNNNTVKVDYAVQINQEMIEPIAEKIKQRKIIVENKKKEKIMAKQKALEARTNALAEAAALAAAAINNNNTNKNDAALFPMTYNIPDKELDESEELLLRTLTEKIDEYEKLENCERKEKLKNDIEELSSFLDYI